MAFAGRKAFAVLVFVGAVWAAVAIGLYQRSTDYGYAYETPWWAIPTAVAVGVLGLALFVRMYPRDDAAAGETGMVAFALRRLLATVVLLFAGINVIWIAQYRPHHGASYGRDPVMLPLIHNYLGTGPAPLWWPIPTAVAIGLLGLAVAAAVDPHRVDRSPESWVKGFRAASVFHRPLPPRSS